MLCVEQYCEIEGILFKKWMKEHVAMILVLCKFIILTTERFVSCFKLLYLHNNISSKISKERE